MLKKQNRVAYLWIWVLSLFLCACSGNDGEVILIGDTNDAEEWHSDEPDEETSEMEDPEWIRIYVCGAVRCPGVVEVSAGSRVEDALAAAGGFAENANRYYVNLADWVTDGQMLYFPTEEELQGGVLQTPWESSSGESATGLVNINTADAALLCTLPGIGESRAAEIIAYREKNGPFESCEDIMSVSGIKTGLYEKICDRITVD